MRDSLFIRLFLKFHLWNRPFFQAAHQHKSTARLLPERTHHIAHRTHLMSKRNRREDGFLHGRRCNVHGRWFVFVRTGGTGAKSQ
ncbi:MAG: hypothetical protein BWY09_02255 [Candidatus Hydrogenedentes bacterium ADurb.Bin179]|nr:MAG: hypothetical protein BWY09_02255 [Candidatus Hydrogenedentes bacterium ADurb.Bin179]